MLLLTKKHFYYIYPALAWFINGHSYDKNHKEEIYEFLIWQYFSFCLSKLFWLMNDENFCNLTHLSASILMYIA